MPTTDNTTDLELTRGQVDKLTAALTAISAAVREAILVLNDDVTRASHCSCGRPAREVLDGGEHEPTGYCGMPGILPLDPCDCDRAELSPHDRSVCHIYGTAASRRQDALKTVRPKE